MNKLYHLLYKIHINMIKKFKIFKINFSNKLINVVTVKN
jgi:hypothetical protein